MENLLQMGMLLKVAFNIFKTNPTFHLPP